jgi:hypothetical protein
LKIVNHSILLSYSDGVFYITDGQHRYLAADRNNETHLPAIIRTGLTQKDEAQIFVSQNDNVSRLTPYDTFKGNILLGDKVDGDIQELTTKYNLDIKQSTGSNKNVLGSLSEARQIVKNNGKDCLEWIFKIIKASRWENEKGAYSSYVIRALKSVYMDNIDDLEDTGKIVCDIFENTTPSYFRAEATIDYVERDVKSACIMLLTKKIREVFIEKNNLKSKVVSKSEFAKIYKSNISSN